MQLQRVCHAWHLAAKKIMYQAPLFPSEAAIEKFARSNQDRIVATILPPGLFVRKLCLDKTKIYDSSDGWRYGDLPPKVIAILLKQCTHLESLEYKRNQRVICEAIHSLPRSALVYLKKLPKQHDINDPCVDKYRASLTEVHMLTGSPYSINDLEKFPQLTSVHYTGNVLDACQIIRACSKLGHLSINQRVLSTTTQQTPLLQMEKYSSLKELELRGVTCLRSLALVLPAFSCLTTLWIDNLEISYESDDFASFCDRVNRLQKCQFTISHSTGQTFSKLPLILTNISRPISSSSSSSSTQSGRWTNAIKLSIGTIHSPRLIYSIRGRTRQIEMELPRDFIKDEQLQQDCIDSFGSIADTVTLLFKEPIKNNAINKKNCSNLVYCILQKCSRVQSVEVLSGRYTGIPNAGICNTSVRQLKLVKCNWEPSFLKSLSSICPNLNSMDIREEFHENANINISMPCISMDLVTLNFPYFPIFKTILIRIKLATMPDAISYYLVQERSKQATRIPPQDVRDIIKGRDVSSINLDFEACKTFEYNCENGPVIAISPETLGNDI